MIVKATDLIEKFRYALDNDWGYIWGKYGQVWTASEQRAATRPQTVDYGQQWIGHHVADCSGLGYWAFQQLGGYIYHGSNTIWNQYVTGRCELKNGKRTDGKTILPCDPVFKTRIENGKPNRHHIGYYVGGDTVIEAKGTRYGVVISKLSEWDETAHWLNVEYENGVVYVNRPVLRKGASGDSVKELQELLNEHDAGLTVDGKFGVATDEAVRAYQAAHGLVVDGVVGAATWDSLAPVPDLEPEQGADTVAVSRDELAQQRRKLEEVTKWIDKTLSAEL